MTDGHKQLTKYFKLLSSDVSMWFPQQNDLVAVNGVDWVSQDNSDGTTDDVRESTYSYSSTKRYHPLG